MDPRILRKLRGYRARIRACLTAEGLSYVVMVTVGCILISLVLDYWQSMGRPARAFSLVVGLAVIAYVLYRGLVSKLQRPMDDARIALTVEDLFPELRDRLISSLQFAGMVEGGAAGRSEQSIPMMSAVMAETAEAVAPLDVGRTLDYGRLVRAIGGALLAAAVLVGTSFITDQGVNVLGRWFQRNVLLMNIRWPQRTHLDVLINDQPVPNFRKVIPKGDPMAVSVIARGVLPSRVYLRYSSTVSRRGGEEEVGRIGAAEDRKFEMRFKNVIEPMTFRVYGGDAETDEYKISLVDRPTVMQLKFRVVYPYYTRVPPRVTTAAESFVDALQGSEVKVAVLSTKPLVSARLVMSDMETVPMVKAGPAADADFDLQGRAGEEIAASRLWTGSIRVSTDCAVVIRMVDTDGLDNVPPTRFTVKVVPDKEPLVALRLRGIGEMITPSATLPLDFKVTDDYGVTGLRISHKFLSGEKYSDEEHIDYTKPLFGGKQLVHQENWPLARLSLQPGFVFIFRAEATDSKEPEPRNVGKTEDISLKVVSPEELMADLMRRQMEQAQDFIRIRDRQQDEIKIEIDAADREVQKSGNVTADQKKWLSGGEDVVNHSAQEIAHVVRVLDQVHQEMVNNKVGEADEQSDLANHIIKPLRRVAEELMPAMAKSVAAAAAAPGPGEALKTNIAKAAAQNNEILGVMNQVLAKMVKMQTFRAIVETARKIREDQQKLLTEVDMVLKAILGVD